MGLFLKLLLAVSFGICFLWLSSLTAISGNPSIVSFKGTNSIWFDALLGVSPYVCLVAIAFVFSGRFRPIMLISALLFLVFVGVWLRFSGVNR